MGPLKDGLHLEGKRTRMLRFPGGFLAYKCLDHDFYIGDTRENG